MKSNATRFGTTAVLLHWTSAALVLILIISGFRAGFAEDAATKTAALRIHVPVAILVLAATISRVIWWWRFDTRPDAPAGIPAWQDRTARWTHRALYGVLFLLLASGVAMSVMSGLPLALFGGSDLPELSTLPPRGAHGLGARVLVALVLIHAGAALYHHVILRDTTLQRMWFRTR